VYNDWVYFPEEKKEQRSGGSVFSDDNYNSYSLYSFSLIKTDGSSYK